MWDMCCVLASHLHLKNRSSIYSVPSNVRIADDLIHPIGVLYLSVVTGDRLHIQ